MIKRSRASLTGVLLRASLSALALLVACASARAASEEPAHSAELDAAIIKQAQRNGVPEKLVRRIVMRESRYNPRARNHSFWGLMQISYPTAKSMGFKGTPEDLLNPIVNLRYAVPYLANAFVIAGKREDAAVRLYASGYYSAARQRGLLGALRTADTAPVAGQADEPMFAAAAPPQSEGIFGSLFGAAPAPQVATIETASFAASDGQPASMAPAGPPLVALPQGKNAAEAGLDMSADTSGALHPPKKWLRDGGMTQVARGEQVADHDPSTAVAEARSARARSRKKTNFAALDEPPANAQAYAATVEGQDTRLTRADSQAAIQQITSGAPAASERPPGETLRAATAEPNARPAPDAAPGDKPAKKSRASHKSHAKKGADKPAGESETASDAAGVASDDTAAVPHKRSSRHAALKPQAEQAPPEQPPAPAAQ